MIGKVTGVPEVMKNLDKFQALMANRFQAATLDSVLEVERQAKLRAPVRTGLLRSRIRGFLVKATQDEVLGRTESGAPYSLPVELGHGQHPGQFVPRLGKRLVARFVKARAFLFPAFEASFRKIKRIFGSVKIG